MTEISPALYNEALRVFGVEGILVVSGDSPGEPFGYVITDNDEAIRGLVAACLLGMIERSRWGGCPGRIDTDGSIIHETGEPCPLHHGDCVSVSSA